MLREHQRAGASCPARAERHEHLVRQVPLSAGRTALPPALITATASALEDTIVVERCGGGLPTNSVGVTKNERPSACRGSSAFKALLLGTVGWPTDKRPTACGFGGAQTQ